MSKGIAFLHSMSLTLVLISGAWIAHPAKAEQRGVADVGPEAMPAEIEPIHAPFAMPALGRPDFGARRVQVELTAEHQAGRLITPVLQAAIEKLSADGGGVVVLPPGEWRTGRIVLKTGVCLHLPKDTTLRFSGEVEDYLPVVNARYEGLEVMSVGGLIYAYGEERVGITGDGALVGPETGPLRKQWPGLTDTLVDQEAPVSQRVMDGREGRHYFRPQFVFLMHCKDVLIEGVSLRGGPMWNIVPTFCDRVVVRGVSIDSRGVVNGDGVDIESSRNVLVEYCRVNTGDDCYAMKAGRGLDGVRAAKPVENVVMRYNHAVGGFGGVTCGSETAGGIRDVYIHDCVFDDVRHAVYMKTRRPRGGGGQRITVERVRFTSIEHGIFFDMIGSPLYVGELGYRLPRRELTPLTPYYREITLRDIRGVSECGDAIKIKGIPESPARDVLIEDVHIQAAAPPHLRDVKDITIRDSTFRCDESELKLLDAVGVTFSQCRFDVNLGPVEVVVAGDQSDDIRFAGASPPLAEEHVLVKDGAKPDAVFLEPSSLSRRYLHSSKDAASPKTHAGDHNLR